MATAVAKLRFTSVFARPGVLEENPSIETVAEGPTKVAKAAKQEAKRVGGVYASYRKGTDLPLLQRAGARGQNKVSLSLSHVESLIRLTKPLRSAQLALNINLTDL